jgi:uncharacterized membrane protein YbhN (UPF0104 family)
MVRTAGSWRRSVWAVVLGLVAVGGLIGVLASQWDVFERALGRLGQLSLWWLGGAVAVEVVSFVLAAEVQHRLLAAADVRVHRSALIALAYASTTVGAVIPAGTVFSAGYSYRTLTRRDASPGVATWVLTVSAVVSAAMLVLLGVVGAELRGVGFLSSVLGVALATLVAGAAVAAVLGTAWVSGHQSVLDAIADRVIAVMRRGERMLRRRTRRVTSDPDSSGRTPSAVRLEARGWFGVAFVAAANWLTDCSVLALAFASLGLSVPWPGLLLAYIVPQLVGVLPVSCFGLAEGSLTLALVCAGVRPDHAIAATLIYRLVSFWTTLPAGGVALAYLQNWQRSAHRLEPLAS